MKNKYTVSTAIAGAALLGTAVFFPASANYRFEIQGNGSRSDNEINVNSDKNISISQSNDADIDNNVRIVNNTGNNSTSGNTGGDVEVKTGDARANVEISNMAGFNFTQVGSCDCEKDMKVSIQGNGSRSDNEIDLAFDSSVNVDQDNDTDINNNVDIVNNTGGNNAGGDSNNRWFFDRKNSDHEKDYDDNKSYKKYEKEYDRDQYDLGKSHENKGNFDSKKYQTYSKNNDYDKDHGSQYFNNQKDSSDYHKNYLSKYLDGRKNDWSNKYMGYNDHKKNNWKKDYGYLGYDQNKNWSNNASKNYDKDHKDQKYNLSKYNDFSGWLKNYRENHGNTGGDVSIKTGNADANVSINNKANANWFTMN